MWLAGFHGGAPAPVGGQSIVRSAGQCQGVGIVGAAVFPVAVGMMDLAAVGRCGAAGSGAAAVAGEEDETLACAGGAAGAARYRGTEVCLSNTAR